MPIPESELLWIIILGTAIILIVAGSFIGTIILNQRRFISLQGEKLNESKRVEDLLREIPQTIIRAQEEERARVARDLHDGINQMLASIKYRMHITSSKMSGDAKTLEGHVDSLLQDLDKTMEEVKSISHNLHPKVLDELGLNAAIRNLCDRFMERTKIATQYSLLQPSGTLSQELELGIYRLIQESLNNIEKHSHAKRVNLETRQLDSIIEIIIADDGVGLGGDEETAGKHRGLGMKTMRERVALLGGTIHISSDKSRGTSIKVQILVSP